MPNPPIAILVEAGCGPAKLKEALGLSEQCGVPLAAQAGDRPPLLLAVTDSGLEVRLNTPGRSRPIYADFKQLDTRSHAGGARQQPIAKAVGLNRPKTNRPRLIADATAGLGLDSWLLAALGCQVVAIERSPVVAALLRDGLRRVSVDHPEVVQRITVVQGDAREVLPTLQPQPDVVYLDPMFPARRKASALERQSLRVLRAIVGDDPDAQELLKVALTTAQQRVVVKRPRLAEALGGTPVASHQGKSLRYDVHVPGNPLPGDGRGWFRRAADERG